MLEARPLTLKQANEAVDALHRHHKPVDQDLRSRGQAIAFAAHGSDLDKARRSLRVLQGAA